jgi:hypothetical protein
MDGVVGVVFVLWLGSAAAQEDASPLLEESALEATRAYDTAVVRFNTHTHGFPSWAVFQSAVLARIDPGALGRCYASTGRPMQPVAVTEVPLPQEAEDGWQPTAGKGWRREVVARTFIEYRVNTKARVKREDTVGINRHKLSHFTPSSRRDTVVVFIPRHALPSNPAQHPLKSYSLPR